MATHPREQDRGPCLSLHLPGSWPLLSPPEATGSPDCGLHWGQDPKAAHGPHPHPTETCDLALSEALSEVQGLPSDVLHWLTQFLDRGWARPPTPQPPRITPAPRGPSAGSTRGRRGSERRLDCRSALQAKRIRAGWGFWEHRVSGHGEHLSTSQWDVRVRSAACNHSAKACRTR